MSSSVDAEKVFENFQHYLTLKPLMVTTVNGTVVYLKVAKRVVLENSHHKKNNYNSSAMDVTWAYCHHFL